MSTISEQEARQVYEQYVSEGLSMFPPFKGFGMKFIQFSIDEPEMYRILFLSKKEYTFKEYLLEQFGWERLIPYVKESFELNEKDARELCKHIMFYAHGLATLFANSTCVMTEQEISETLGDICRAFLMEIKAPKDERTKVIPSQTETHLGNLTDYIKGKKNVIVGYGASKEMYQIRLDAILYFEAVGENVFAYTKGNVYEIKHRLYKIEEVVKHMDFIRVSKSLLVSVNKISSVSSAEGGRKNILLVNGETVVASRMYVKELMSQLKESEEE